ncbi:septum formation family protein [Demequina flava]|uniref:septum formation family protein n=1 Tax=Demequina flava TaxID=1095025 RepID=UPI0007813B70|nr:septum formation family protein [Demequina flava]
MTRLRMPVVLVAALAAVALSGCSLFAADEPDFDMAAGECVVDESITSDTQTEIGELPVVDCSEPHHGEVYYAEVIDATIYPDNIATTVEEACLENFADYVGVEYAESRYYISLIYPSETTWDEGDRQTACLITGDTDEELTSSVEGSGE